MLKKHNFTTHFIPSQLIEKIHDGKNYSHRNMRNFLIFLYENNINIYYTKLMRQMVLETNNHWAEVQTNTSCNKQTSTFNNDFLI